jgi:LuxR family transcriptional regulator, quorum-sensing system regulator SdiA
LQADRLVLHTLERLATLAPSGFAIGLHISFSTPAFLFQTYPEAWAETYARGGLVMVDPTVTWGLGNSGTVCWEDLREIDKHGVLEKAKSFGLTSGRTWSIHDDETVTIGSMSRREGSFTRSEVDLIGDDMMRLHDATRGVADLDPSIASRIRSISIALTQ